MKNIFILSIVCFLAYIEPAYAYLDPGTGSLLLSAVVGISATAFFMLKAFFYKVQVFYAKLFGISLPKTNQLEFVIYSEGAHYWRTFKPIIEGLLNNNRPVLYLTSEELDPGISFEKDNSLYSSKYIGKSNKAFAALNMLEADVCILTTPGLDVLQIQRSKGVKHYSYVFHAVTDVAFYKLYSFDYFDSVLCSSAHQKPSFRALEEKRGTSPKKLLDTGCPYIDVLLSEKEEIERKTPNLSNHLDSNNPHILVAPTWGNNGLLKKFGTSILKPILEKGYTVTVRPHPQSLRVEADMIESIKKDLSNFPKLSFDTSPNPLEAMHSSNILISDLSGIVFDYAFIFKRPVITIAFTPNLLGQEANDLPHKPWELEVLPKLGAHIQPEQVSCIVDIINKLPSQKEFEQAMEELRSKSIYNLTKSGCVAAEQLITIRDNLYQK